MYAVFGFGRIFLAVLRFWTIFFFGFAVSNTPQCPPHTEYCFQGYIEVRLGIEVLRYLAIFSAVLRYLPNLFAVLRCSEPPNVPVLSPARENSPKRKLENKCIISDQACSVEMAGYLPRLPFYMFMEFSQQFITR